MIYFDNSATTGYKPPEVINSVTNTLKYLSANPGRGGHSMSSKAGLLVYKTREKCAEFLGVNNCERIIFTQNCTMALNIAILGTIKNGGHVITSMYEHNSVLRPLFELERKGIISLTILPPSHNGAVSYQSVENAIKHNTYLIALNHISNVTGAKTPINQIGKLTRSKNILFLVDGAQSVGYHDILFNENNIDLLAIAPHKGLHAAQGAGILAISERVVIKPVFFGGTGTSSEDPFQPSELPEALEAGTVNTPTIASINSAITWNKKHRKFMSEKITELCNYIYEQIEQIENITIYSPKNSGGGIVSFNINSLTSVEVSGILSEQYDICTRGGLHCAPLIHKHLGTLDKGIVRVSPGFESTYSDAKFFIEAVREISKSG